MHITTKPAITVPRSRDIVFASAISNEMFKRTLLAYGPIAGIADGIILDGQPLRQGVRRRITLTDGTILDEDILEHEVPTRHRYKWTSGLKPPFSWLVKSGEGTWTFSEVNDGTRIVWSYVFELRSVLGYPLATPIVGLFRRWQRKGLARIRDEIIKQPLVRAAPARDASGVQASR